MVEFVSSSSAFEDLERRRNKKTPEQKVQEYLDWLRQNAEFLEDNGQEFILIRDKHFGDRAKKRNIKKILMPIHDIDALSNRPAINEYLAGIGSEGEVRKKENGDDDKNGVFGDVKKFPIVELDEKIDFNEYDITDKCVVVR